MTIHHWPTVQHAYCLYVVVLDESVQKPDITGHQWSVWSEWSSCSGQGCGNGQQTRRRSCVVSRHVVDDALCSGQHLQTRVCPLVDCKGHELAVLYNTTLTNTAPGDPVYLTGLIANELTEKLTKFRL